MPRSELEVDFLRQLVAHGIRGWVAEARFDPIRAWRFDFAWINELVALEIQGGTWVKGAHIRGRQYERDAEKLNAAAILGWRVLFATTDMVQDGRALVAVHKILEIPLPRRLALEEAARAGR